jgi:cytochrome c oxidase subunit 2
MRLVRLAPALAAALAIAGCGSSQPAKTESAVVVGTGKRPVLTGSSAQRGQQLYDEFGCGGCHSLDGTRLTGPTWKGLAGSTVHLSDGKTVVADETYLREHIVEPERWHVAGYPAGVMAQATAELNLHKRPAEVADLVAFIESLHNR